MLLFGIIANKLKFEDLKKNRGGYKPKKAMKTHDLF
jgi:hypothetical protein